MFNICPKCKVVQDNGLVLRRNFNRGRFLGEFLGELGRSEDILNVEQVPLYRQMVVAIFIVNLRQLVGVQFGILTVYIINTSVLKWPIFVLLAARDVYNVVVKWGRAH